MTQRRNACIEHFTGLGRQVQDIAQGDSIGQGKFDRLSARPHPIGMFSGKLIEQRQAPHPGTEP
ncbi:hypothetical protein D3C76_1749790 [compost metagenome]